MNSFSFKLNTQIIAGLNSHKNFLKIKNNFKINNILIIIDKNVENNQYIKNFIKKLVSKNKFKILYGPKNEPDFEYLKNLKKESLIFNPTIIFGIGGGSAIDSAKGLSIVLTNSGLVEKYQGLNKYKHKGIPCIAVPTIFGSGASVTPSAVFINSKTNKKGGINGREVAPVFAIIDPIFQKKINKQLLVSSLMDSLVHSIESSVSKNSNNLTKNFAYKGASILFEVLHELKEDKNYLKTIEKLALGEFYSILSLMHSEQGLAGAISYPMGVFNHVPHGIAGGRTLPYAIKYAEKFNKGIWNDLAKNISNWSEKNNINSAEYLSKKIMFYLKYFKIPSLNNWISIEDINNLATETINFKGVMEQTKHTYKKSEIISFLNYLITEEKKYK